MSRRLDGADAATHRDERAMPAIATRMVTKAELGDTARSDEILETTSETNVIQTHGGGCVEWYIYHFAMDSPTCVTRGMCPVVGEFVFVLRGVGRVPETTSGAYDRQGENIEFPQVRLVATGPNTQHCEAFAVFYCSVAPRQTEPTVRSGLPNDVPLH